MAENKYIQNYKGTQTGFKCPAHFTPEQVEMLERLGFSYTESKNHELFYKSFNGGNDGIEGAFEIILNPILEDPGTVILNYDRDGIRRIGSFEDWVDISIIFSHLLDLIKIGVLFEEKGEC